MKSEDKGRSVQLLIVEPAESRVLGETESSGPLPAAFLMSEAREALKYARSVAEVGHVEYEYEKRGSGEDEDGVPVKTKELVKYDTKTTISIMAVYGRRYGSTDLLNSFTIEQFEALAAAFAGVKL